MSNNNQPTAVYTGYKHCCVVDAHGNYVEFVQVHIYTAPDGSTEDRVQHYALKPGERIVDAMVPAKRPHAGAPGLVRPRWDDIEAAWVEGATAEEIAAWDKGHPAPANLAAPTAEEQLRADIDFLAAIQGVEL